MRSTLPHAALTGRYVPLILAGNPLPQHDTQRQSFDVNRLTFYCSSTKTRFPTTARQPRGEPSAPNKTYPHGRADRLHRAVGKLHGRLRPRHAAHLPVPGTSEQKDELRKEADPNGLCYYKGSLARVLPAAPLRHPVGTCAIGVMSPARTWSPGAASPSPSPRPSNRRRTASSSRKPSSARGTAATISMRRSRSTRTGGRSCTGGRAFVEPIPIRRTTAVAPARVRAPRQCRGLRQRRQAGHELVQLRVQGPARSGSSPNPAR